MLPKLKIMVRMFTKWVCSTTYKIVCFSCKTHCFHS